MEVATVGNKYGWTRLGPEIYNNNGINKKCKIPKIKQVAGLKNLWKKLFIHKILKPLKIS